MNTLTLPLLLCSVALAACAPADDMRLGLPLAAPTPASASQSARSERVDLGRMLFFDRRLSATREVSCASCHDVVNGGSGADRSHVSTGVSGRRGRRNAPTVWNASDRAALFWDGRAASLEAQAAGPLLNPDEMAMTDERAVERALERIRGYREAFARAFADERSASGRATISFREVVSAIATFERTLAAKASPFDRYASGGLDAITPEARRGWVRFQTIGCVACHGEPTFARGDYFVRFPLRPVPELDAVLGLTLDPGRGDGALTSNRTNTWRIPSLRNVALTAPYLHNGSVQTLDQMVRLMGRAQLAIALDDDDVRDIVAFLDSLTGVRPRVTAPTLPPDDAAR